MAGILGAPPGLRGYLLAQQADQQRQASELGQIQGVLGIQGALMQQQQAQQEMADREKMRSAIQGMPGIGDNPLLSQIAMQNPSALLPHIMPKPRDPVSVSPGASLVDPDTGKTIFAAPPKPEAVPATIQEYNLAKEQGFQGSIADYQLAKRKAGATNVTVPVDLAGNAYAKAVGGKAADRDIAQHDTVIAATDNVTKLDTLINHLQTSDAITGPAAEFQLGLEKAKQLVMRDVQAGKKVSDTELLDAMMGSEVFPMIKALGVGARGMDTPAEREFMRKALTGEISMNKDTLIKMAQIRRDIATRAIERWDSRVQSGELDNFFKYTMSPKKTIGSPAARQSGAPSGVRKFNPATGRIE